MKFLFSISALVFAIGASSLQAQLPAIANSASAPIPPVPAPTVAPPLAEKKGPSATLTFAGTAPLKVQSRNGMFRVASIRPRETVDIKLQFSSEWASMPLVLQALDGGNVPAKPTDAVIANDGSASFRFQAGDQPGLYRVSVMGAGGSSTLKFWVADPKNPKANPPVLNPGH